MSDFRLFGPEAFGGSAGVIGSEESGVCSGWGEVVVTSCVVVVVLEAEFWIRRLWQRLEVVVS